MKRIPKESRIAVVTGNPEHGARDRDTLLRQGFQDIQMFGEAGEALDFLTRAPVDMVLIDSVLHDMQANHCIRVIRSNSKFRLLPVVMVTVDNRLETVLDAIAAGVSGYILRPYSVATFERHLALAWNSSQMGEIERDQLKSAQEMLGKGRFEEAAGEFHEIVSDPGESLRLFDAGASYLVHRNFGKAVSCFNEAVSHNAMFAEAYRGLAYAYKGQHDEESYAAYLKKAAECFAFQDRLQETKDIFVEIIKAEPDAPNPYNTLGVELRRKGDLDGALHAYEQALLLSPSDEVVHYNIAKALLVVGDAAKAGQYARQALALNPDFLEAAELVAMAEAEALSRDGVTSTARPPAGRSGGLRVDRE